MNLSVYSDLQAAFGFRLEDLHEAIVAALARRMGDLSNNQIYLKSSDSSLMHLFVSTPTATFNIRKFDLTSPRQVVVEFAHSELILMILSDQDFQDGVDPDDGLKAQIEVRASEFIFEIGLNERVLPGIDYDQDDVLSPKQSIPQETNDKIRETKTTSLGASSSSEIDIEFTSETQASIWLEDKFPNFRQAIRDVLLSDIVLISNVRKDICKNVILAADESVQSLEHSYEPKEGEPYPALIIGSKKAELFASDCPNYFSKLILDMTSEEIEAKTEVVSDGSGNGKVLIPELKVRQLNLLSKGYERTANQIIENRHKRFHIWMSKELLGRTFNRRLGKNIGALLGAHYDDKWGIVKWWLSGGWILKGIDGAVKINPSAASVELDFLGRTKFDAMGYVDLDCVQVEIGSLDAFHERFDFTLFSEIYVSWKDGKVVFKGGFKDIEFEYWRSFLRFILDKYVSSWKYLVGRLIVDYVFSKFFRAFIEDEVTNAMGSISIDLMDLTDVPVLGDWFESMLPIDEHSPWPRTDGSSSANEFGIEFIAGAKRG